MRKKILGVIGDSDPTPEIYEKAAEVGRLAAGKGWVVLTGGLSGVMEAACKGAKAAGGETVGILPCGGAESANPFVDIAIPTNMGHARNAIIAHSADFLIAVGGGYGTLSEIAIALKLGKPVFTIDSWEIKGAMAASDPESAIEMCEGLV